MHQIVVYLHMPTSTSTDTPFRVALAFHPNIGARTFQKLLARFPTIESVWSATPTQLNRAGISQDIVTKVAEARQKFDPERVMQTLRRLDIGVIVLGLKNYPTLLRELPDPPAVLFVKGKVTQHDDLLLAVVGSRKFSIYGKRLTEEIVPELVAAGVTIVSGLALGIDGIAHEASLVAGGKTIAVLGCGLDAIYPSSHAALAHRILAQGGALLSEFPPGVPSYPSNFPIRNRIIAGLSLGTFVVEGSLESGSLLTAKAALEYNREVFAAPADIFRETAAGTNNLLKMGATVVTSASDILAALSIPQRNAAKKAREVVPDTPEEAVLLQYISDDPVHIDVLVKSSKMEVERVGSTLILMEMKGKIRNVGANQYVKVG